MKSHFTGGKGIFCQLTYNVPVAYTIAMSKLLKRKNSTENMLPGKMVTKNVNDFSCIALE